MLKIKRTKTEHAILSGMNTGHQQRSLNHAQSETDENRTCYIIGANQKATEELLTCTKQTKQARTAQHTRKT